MTATRQFKDYSNIEYQTIMPGDGIFERWIRAENVSDTASFDQIRLAGSTSDEPSIAEVFHRASYLKLHEALKFMAACDEDEIGFIDDDTYQQATAILGQLSGASVAPPRVFSHGPDAVVFTWSRVGYEWLLTVSEGRVSLLEVDTAGQQKLRMKGDASSQEFVDTLEILRGKTWPTTTYV